MRNRSAMKRSTMPAASGSSGPTTVRSMRFSLAKRSKSGRSLAGMATFSASCAVPALPGAQNIRSTSGDCFSFHTSACSRPPEPMTRTFTAMIQTSENRERFPFGFAQGKLSTSLGMVRAGLAPHGLAAFAPRSRSYGAPEEARATSGDSAGKIGNSSFSVCRMIINLAATPICSPTSILCNP